MRRCQHAGSTRRCWAAKPPSSSGGFLNSIDLPTQIKPFWDFQWCAGGSSLPRTLQPAPASSGAPRVWEGHGDEDKTALW